MLTFYGGAASLDVGGLFDGGGKTAAESILHRLSAVSDADVSASTTALSTISLRPFIYHVVNSMTQLRRLSPPSLISLQQ